MSRPTIPNLERMVRSNDDDTSWDAAQSTTPEALSALQSWIILALTAEPRTDEELCTLHREARFYKEIALGATPQRIRTARKELTDAGKVEFSGMYGQTQYKRRTQIWRVTA